MCNEQNTQIPLAKLESVSKRYGNLVALKNLNLTVNAGRTLALLGPNGAGKTRGPLAGVASKTAVTRVKASS